MAAPTVVASVTAANQGDSVVLNAASLGVQNGDVLVVGIRSQATIATDITRPSGWARGGTGSIPASDRALGIFYKPIPTVSAEGVMSYTFTGVAGGGSSRIIATLVVLRGANLASLNGGGVAYDTDATLPASTASGVPYTAIALWGGEFTDGASVVPSSIPAGFTTVANAQTAGGASSVVPNTNTTGSRTGLVMAARAVATGTAVPSLTVAWPAAPVDPKSALWIVRGIVDTAPTPMGVPVKNGTGQTVWLSYLDGAGVRRAPASVRYVEPGPQAVTGSLPVGTASYDVPAGAVTVTTTAQLASAVTSATAGRTIVVKGGVYNVSNIRPTVPLTIQNAPGETVWFDGTGLNTGCMTIKSAATIRGIGIRNYPTTTDPWNRGVIIPDGADGTTFENVVIEDMAYYAVRAFECADVTFRNVTIRRSGLLHLGTGFMQNMTVENMLLEDANRDNIGFNPLTEEPSAWKDTVSRGLKVDGLKIVNAPNWIGLWLDQSCYQFDIKNVSVEGCPKYGIHIEICGFGTVENAKVLGATQFSFYSLDSTNVTWKNCEATGTAQVTFMFEQDERRATPGDSRAPYIAEGIDYVSRNNSLINCTGPTATNTYARVMIFDGTNAIDGRTMMGTVAGNLLPPRVAGGSASVQLGTPVRSDYSLSAFQALAPDRFYGNGTTLATTTRI